MVCAKLSLSLLLPSNTSNHNGNADAWLVINVTTTCFKSGRCSLE
jgi:hypothetical protein